MTSKLSRSIPDDFVVTGSPPLSAASRRPREVQQRSWLAWLSIQGRTDGRERGRTIDRILILEENVSYLPQPGNPLVTLIPVLRRYNLRLILGWDGGLY